MESGNGASARTWIALFRGINVGGNNILPMADLREDLEALGLHQVRTYIQSGNVVFEAAGAREEIREWIERSVQERHGFRPAVLLLSGKDLRSIAAANPFPEAEADPKTLHVQFLAEPATEADLEGMARWRSENERFHLTEDALYFHAPDGIGRSKLAARMERLLGVAGTGRNFRTVAILLAMTSA